MTESEQQDQHQNGKRKQFKKMAKVLADSHAEENGEYD